MTVVLVVDDVQTLADQYAYDLNRLGGFDTIVALGGHQALDALASEVIDCVILDLEMPGTDGLDVLRQIQADGLEAPVIVYTGTGSYERCTQAIRLGAYSFIDKAEPVERVVQEVQNALERQRLAGEVRRLRTRLGEGSPLVGTSPAMDRLLDTITRVAPIPSPVLIVGESGTGKELVAREIHRISTGGTRPTENPFVALNCAALPEQLVESELFGHERGAFTGAATLRKGAFESAGSGTLFLDEVGELALPMQAKLLRVLEQREVTRLGGNRVVSVKARVLAATNRDLEHDVSAGSFRQDLYYRLNVHVVQVPPLRERRSDIALLVAHFVTVLCERFGMRRKEVSADALANLAAFDWTRNNVRELRNVVERAIIAADGETISVRHLPAEIAERHGDARPDREPTGLRELRARAERAIIVEALERNEWRVTSAARELGLADHSSLLKIMRRHGIVRPETP